MIKKFQTPSNGVTYKQDGKLSPEYHPGWFYNEHGRNTYVSFNPETSTFSQIVTSPFSNIVSVDENSGNEVDSPELIQKYANQMGLIKGPDGKYYYPGQQEFNNGTLVPQFTSDFSGVQSWTLNGQPVSKELSNQYTNTLNWKSKIPSQDEREFAQAYQNALIQPTQKTTTQDEYNGQEQKIGQTTYKLGSDNKYAPTPPYRGLFADIADLNTRQKRLAWVDTNKDYLKSKGWTDQDFTAFKSGQNARQNQMLAKHYAGLASWTPVQNPQEPLEEEVQPAQGTLENPQQSQTQSRSPIDNKLQNWSDNYFNQQMYDYVNSNPNSVFNRWKPTFGQFKRFKKGGSLY